ncbi:PilZ domain-containing protein [bacterium]|nr:PilZ domain-containing protein [candidate division CSSED10-310 bacterium]
MDSGSNENRRRSERYKTVNLLSYRDEADNGESILSSMAQTIDVSENGAMIQLQQPLNNPLIAELEFAFEDEIVPITGLIVEQFQTDDGLWRIRVEFRDLKPVIRHKLLTFLMNLR